MFFVYVTDIQCIFIHFLCAAEPQGTGYQFERRHSLPLEKDTSLQASTVSGLRQSLSPRHPRLQPVDQNDATSLAGSVFDFLSYSDVDSGQRQEFQFLLARVCTCFV